MNILRRFYCRIYQTIFRIAIPFLPYRSPKIVDLKDLDSVLAENKITSLCVITDGNLRGMAEKIVSGLTASCHIYDKTMPNPTIAQVEDARAFYLQRGCDGLLAIGGGSVMDLAKVVGARIVRPKKTVEKMAGLLRIRKKIPPLITIPTTAGTGSETTLAAVITDEKTHHKYPINDFCLIPHYAVLEPSLLAGLPKGLTATTGMDALTHAVEAYIGRSTTKKTRKASLLAVRLICQNLLRSYEHPEDLTARKNMLEASHQAGIAFTVSYVGYVHAIAHSLGGQYGIPHGLANAIILPILLEAYGPSCERKLAALAKEGLVADDGDDDKLAARKFIDFIYDLNGKMGIPRHIPQIREEDIDRMASFADKEGNPLYPVPKLFDKKELETFYRIIRGDENE